MQNKIFYSGTLRMSFPTDATVKHNIEVLKNLKQGSKLLVNYDTLELTEDARYLKAMVRKENRHECLIPIVISLLLSGSDFDVVSTLKRTYSGKFPLLDSALRLVDFVEKKTYLRSQKVLEEELKQQKDKIDNLEKAVQEKNKAIKVYMNRIASLTRKKK